MTRAEHILICAVRYALGRQTYIVGIVAEYVNSVKEKLSDHCKDVLIRDIQEEIERYHKMGMTCGMDIDEQTWLNLLDALKGVE